MRERRNECTYIAYTTRRVIIYQKKKNKKIQTIILLIFDVQYY